MAKTQKGTGKRQEDPTLSARDRAALKRRAEACIDAFMMSVGYKDPSEQTDENGWRHFHLGSARGFAYVVETDDDVIFHAAAKVMDLPSDKDLTLPLFRELLELNLMLSGSTRTAVRDNFRTPDMRLGLFERLMGLNRQLQAEAGPGEFGSQGVELGA